MTYIELIAIPALAVLSALVVAYCLGERSGRVRGEAIGWQDGYFKRIADDRKHAAKKLRNLKGGAK
jgi:cell division protein ZapA (FtsZ GTPase activity inhibitor)